MLFPDDFKRRFDNTGALGQVEADLIALRALRIDESYRSALSPVSITPANVAILMQAGLRRTLELSETAVQEMLALRIVSTCVLVRAAFETCCLLCDVARRVEAVARSNDLPELDALDSYLKDMVLGRGRKAFVLAEDVIVQNIVTVIQGLTKHTGTPFDGFYEDLCEYSHPNYLGVIANYTPPDHSDGATKFRDRREERDRRAILNASGALAAALGAFLSAHGMWSKNVRAFAAVVERQVFERGTWPSDVAYPIRRDAS